MVGPNLTTGVLIKKKKKDTETCKERRRGEETEGEEVHLPSRSKAWTRFFPLSPGNEPPLLTP